MFLNTLAHTVSSFRFCFVFQVWKCTQGGRSELSNCTGRQLPASSRSSGEGWSVLSTQHRPTAKTNRTPESQQPLCVLYCPWRHAQDCPVVLGLGIQGQNVHVVQTTPYLCSNISSAFPPPPQPDLSVFSNLLWNEHWPGDLSCVCLLGPWLPSL